MTVRSQSLRSPSHSTVPQFAPEWAQEAAEWLRKQQPAWRVVGLLVGILFLVGGFIMLVFGGYTSIQGVRIPLDFFIKRWGYTIATEGTPAWYWWLIPLLTNFVQIFFKRIPGLKALWRPSVAFDGLTTAVFLSLGFLDVILQLGANPTTAVFIAGAVSAITGLTLTLLSEKLFLGAFPILAASLTPNR